MSSIAATGFCAYFGIIMLSVHRVPPSFGTVNCRFVPAERFCWKMSPDQAMVIQVSPLDSALM